MSLHRLSKFMLSDAGKKVSYYLAGTCTLGISCSYFLPHTICLDYYRQLVQLYKKGFEVPISKNLQDRFQKTLDVLEIEGLERTLYNPFYVCGFDAMSAGSSYSKFGVIVGIPSNFSYDNPDTIDTSQILINHESIIWELEPSQNLLKSLVLSENAQMYVMAREIKYRQTAKPMIDMTVGVNCVIATYCLCSHFNGKFNFYAKPFGLRLALYSLVGMFMAGIYVMIKDTSQIYYEDWIDKELRKKNKLFVEGGKEFYSKILERNKALRHLLGKDGESLYSVLGNENFLFRTKHVPIVQRLSNFETQH